MRKVLTIFLLLHCFVTLANNDEQKKTYHAQNKQLVTQSYKTNLKQYKNNPDILVLPGLVANKKLQQVNIQAEATGIAGGEPLEFLLIGETSDYDYEAIAHSFALPSDIHKALEFIGLQKGHTADYSKTMMWPKGERVIVTFDCKSLKPYKGPIRAEDLTTEFNKQKKVSQKGYIFTGSRMVPAFQEPSRIIYEADEIDPQSIISNYNEIETVLDVSCYAPQGSVYDNNLVNKEYVFPAYAMLEIVMRPEYKNGKKRVTNILLSVSPAQQKTDNIQDQTTENILDNLRFSISFNETTESNLTVHAMIKNISTLINDGHTPYVTLKLADNMSLSSMHKVAELLASIENDTGIRMEPPLPGDLYFKAYIPDEHNRYRENRIGQPLELKLSLKDSILSGTLIHIRRTWKDNQSKPDLHPVEYPIPSPDALLPALEKIKENIPAIFVYAPSELTHAQLLTFISSALKTHPLIHVYIYK